MAAGVSGTGRLVVNARRSTGVRFACRSTHSPCVLVTGSVHLCDLPGTVGFAVSPRGAAVGDVVLKLGMGKRLGDEDVRLKKLRGGASGRIIVPISSLLSGIGSLTCCPLAFGSLGFVLRMGSVVTGRGCAVRLGRFRVRCRGDIKLMDSGESSRIVMCPGPVMSKGLCLSVVLSGRRGLCTSICSVSKQYVGGVAPIIYRSNVGRLSVDKLSANRCVLHVMCKGGADIRGVVIHWSCGGGL